MREKIRPQAARSKDYFILGAQITCGFISVRGRAEGHVSKLALDVSATPSKTLWAKITRCPSQSCLILINQQSSIVFKASAIGSPKVITGENHENLRIIHACSDARCGGARSKRRRNITSPDCIELRRAGIKLLHQCRRQCCPSPYV